MFELKHGDCLDVLRTMADNTIDAIVTDPPYGLSFMGKRWDYDVPDEAVWRECLRVLKPGGHLLAFAGTRTQHRMAVRIEDAGFEIRDMIAWVYGSGFPKSLDVSKAIDRQRDDQEDINNVVRWLEAARVASGVSRRQVEQHFGTQNIGQALFTITPGSQSRVATWDQWLELKALLGFGEDMDAEVWRLNGRKGKPGEAWFDREVVGQKTSGIANKDEGTRHTIGAANAVVVDITAPSTPAARQWQGWGTALKPALEPITVARKPLVGTVANNVLTWGTGGVNVDGCRVDSGGTHGSALRAGQGAGYDAHNQPGRKYGNGLGGIVSPPNPAGRFPANFIHDGSEEVVGLFPETKSGKPGGSLRQAKGMVLQGGGNGTELTGFGDSGSAARFFYCAKASKRDRDEGCEGMRLRTAGERTNRAEGSAGITAYAGAMGEARNHHPTVKPTDLMRYLCRLVTPPNGTVLDPFMGSGSTGKAAILEGFNFIGIEREAEYLEIARARIDHVTKEPNLWQS